MNGKRRSGTIAFLMMVMLAVAMLPMVAGTAYADIVASGECGTCLWSIDNDGRFILEPKVGNYGELGNWVNNVNLTPPWYGARSQIKSVQFKGTVKAPGYIGHMFENCNNLTAVDLSGFDTTDVTDMINLFYRCTSLKTIDLSGLNTPNLEKIDNMFSGCTSLTSVDFSDFDTSSVRDMDALFKKCTSLTSIDLSDLKTLSLLRMQEMFDGCENLTFIDLSSFNTTSTKVMARMFQACNSLQTIVVGDTWSTDNVTMDAWGANMFNGCTNLVGGNNTTYDPNHVNKDYARVDLPGTPGYFTHVKTIVHPVTVTVEGEGTASASPDSGLLGTEVALTAEPDTGWHFKEWEVISGRVTIDENNKFTIGNKDVEVKAVFEKCSSVCEETKEVKATCTEDGTAAYWTCKTCGKMYSDKDCMTVITKPAVIPKTGHKLEKVDEVKATCTKDGTKTYWTCKNCKKLFSDKDGKTEITKPTVIPKTGHNWGDWKTTKEPTETATGEKQRVCKNDSSHVEKETIPIKKSESKPTSETETQAKNVSGIPLAKMIAKGKKSLKITWMKVDGAEGYDIFFAACGQNEKKTKCKLVKSITGNSKFSWIKTKLKAKKAYKAYVKAWVMENGNKKYVGTSPSVHAFTANGTKTQTNAKNVKVEKTKISVKKGKTKKIKVVSVGKVKSKLELMDKSHAAKLRYLSTDKKIATVNKSGKIKGVSKGSCYVYVYAHNGVSKRITVTVK